MAEIKVESADSSVDVNTESLVANIDEKSESSIMDVFIKRESPATEVKTKSRRRPKRDTAPREKFECSISNCGRVFARKDDRNRHVKESHENGNKSTCKACDKQMLKRSLNRHYHHSCQRGLGAKPRQAKQGRKRVIAEPCQIKQENEVAEEVGRAEAEEDMKSVAESWEMEEVPEKKEGDEVVVQVMASTLGTDVDVEARRWEVLWAVFIN